MADPRNSSDNSSGQGLIGRAKSSAAQQLTNQKNRAADGIGSVTQALRQSTQHLRDDHHETIARYVDHTADQIDRWCDQLRDKDVADMLDDVQRLARRQPAAFVGSAFALGLLGARFLKSSSDEGKPRRWESSRSQYGGADHVSEAADGQDLTRNAAVSDVDQAISRPEPDTAAPAPGGGAGASARTRRSGRPTEKRV